MAETVHFVNKSASDAHLSRSVSYEDFGIRRFIQKRNRRLERTRKSAVSTVDRPERASFLLSKTIVLNSDEQRNSRKSDSHHDRDDHSWAGELQIFATYSGLIQPSKSLSHSRLWSTVEKRAVSYFTGNFAARFVSPDCSAFWQIWMPCILEQDATVRQLITALAFFCQAYDSTALHAYSTRHNERTALLCYNQAIATILADGSNMPKLILVITCILVVSIETLRGNLMACEVCISTSLSLSDMPKSALLEYRWAHPIVTTESTPAERAVQVTQAKMVAAFNVFVVNPTPPDCSYAEVTNAPLVERQSSFMGIEHVISAAEKLIGASFRALESLRVSYAVGDGSMPLMIAKSDFSTFLRKLRQFQSSLRPPLATNRLYKLSLFQEMKVLEAQIVFNAIVLEKGEMAFDEWTTSFERIVDIAQDSLEAQVENAHHFVYEPFSVTFLSALWLVASRCRAPILRRRALNLLLRHPRREKMFDSRIIRHVAQEIVNIEEGAGPSHANGTVPFAQRIVLQNIVYTVSAESIKLTFLRQKPGGTEFVQKPLICTGDSPPFWLYNEGRSLEPLLRVLLIYSRNM